MSTARFLLRLIRLRLALFAVASALPIVATSFPLLGGLVMREFFDTLTGDATAERNIWLLVLLGIDFVTIVTQMAYEFVSPLFANLSRALVRINLFRNVLKRPPIQDSPSSGDAINRFSQDVRAVVTPIGRDKATAMLGFVVSIPLAVFVMVGISPMMTAVALVPMVAVTLLTRGWRTESDATARPAVNRPVA